MTGMEGDIVTMQDIFRFRQTGIDAEGKVLGRFEATGVRPRFTDKLASRGSSLSPDLFRPEARFEA